MVVFADDNIIMLENVLGKYCEFNKFRGREITNEILKQSGCEILFTRSQTQVNGNLLHGTNVKVVATATSGTDHFDIEYLELQGIKYYDAVGTNANSVAEFVLYSVIKYCVSNDLPFDELTIGIVGFGNIGKIVAKYSELIGLKVLINDPPLYDTNFPFPEYTTYVDFDTLLIESDIITNHVPLTFTGQYKTFQLFDTIQMSKVKKCKLFLHTSRGNVVAENALLSKCLNEEMSVVIDVWENEPDFNSELAKTSLIATPHIAGHSYEGKLNGTLKMIEIFEEYSNLEVDKTLLFDEINKSTKYIITDFISRSELVLQIDNRRKISHDNLSFKEVALLDIAEKKIKFDDFRKKYPIRNELLKI